MKGLIDKRVASSEGNIAGPKIEAQENIPTE